MGKCYVTARITAKAGMGSALQAEIERNIPLVRQEAGCIRYDLLGSTDKGDVFLFNEVWADRAALAAHAAAPHMLAYKERTKDLLACPTSVEIWSAVNAAE